MAGSLREPPQDEDGLSVEDLVREGEPCVRFGAVTFPRAGVQDGVELFYDFVEEDDGFRLGPHPAESACVELLQLAGRSRTVLPVVGIGVPPDPGGVGHGRRAR